MVLWFTTFLEGMGDGLRHMDRDCLERRFERRYQESAARVNVSEKSVDGFIGLNGAHRVYIIAVSAREVSIGYWQSSKNCLK